MCLAIPGRVEEIRGADPLMRSARVSFGGVTREVSLAYVPEAEVGDHVLVHVGMAISVIDEDEARKVQEALAELGEATEAELEERRAAGWDPTVDSSTPGTPGRP